MAEPDLRVPGGMRLVAVGLLLLAMMLAGCSLQLTLAVGTWEWWTWAGFAAWLTLGASQVGAAYALYEGEPLGAIGGALIGVFAGFALIGWCVLLFFAGLVTPLVFLTGAWEIVGGLLAAMCIPASRRLRAARATLET